jgi:glycosyltransferase involved in cell wall biosynthesis
VNRPDILLISTDEFSGVRPALMAALQRAGCRVVYVRQRLGELGWRKNWFRLQMVVSAMFHYGRHAEAMMWRTPAAFAAGSHACRAIVDRHPSADIVILVAANFDNYWGTHPPGKLFFIYTDYMNLMSKALPDHGFPLDERNTLPKWNELERQILQAQDHIFVMGAHVKPAIVAHYGISKDKVTVVGAGPGLDLDIERDEIQKDYRGRRILFVGKLPGKKGLAVLMKAFCTVRAVFPDAELHVVTGAPVSGPGIVFHGRTSAAQLKALFYSASVFSLPAFKEPLGLVYLEAMLAKCACIGTSTGSMPEIIEEGVTGYLVTPGDDAALAERIIVLLSDPERIRSMGELGYRRAREYWNWDQVVQRMQGVWSRTPSSNLGHPAEAPSVPAPQPLMLSSIGSGSAATPLARTLPRR